jgi:Uma2 family endonuclease
MSITEARKPRPRRLLEGFPPDTRIVVAGVTWEDYDRFSRAVRDGENCRVAFDGKDIELMVLGPFHESIRGIVDAFIAIVARELGVEHRAVGSTTWKRKKVKRGIESNMSYYFDAAKLTAYNEAFARRSDKVKDYRNPDLAIEIDITPSKIDRPGIYAALQVPEIWQFANESVVIETLAPAGTYVAAASSRFLHVRPEEVARWVFVEESPRGLAWEQRLRDWVRNELVSRVDA